MIISVKVKPGAKIGPKIEEIGENDYVAYLHERAKDGEANAGLVKLLAKYFNVPKSTITIKSGQTSRNKIIKF